MKNFTKNFVVLALSTLMIYSCSSSSVVSNGIIQKRKYNKGFFHSKKTKIDRPESTLAGNEKTEKGSQDQNKEEVVFQVENITPVSTTKNENLTVTTPSTTNVNEEAKHEITETKNETVKESSIASNPIKVKEEESINNESIVKTTDSKYKSTADIKEKNADTIAIIALILAILGWGIIGVALVPGTGTKEFKTTLILFLIGLLGIILSLVLTLVTGSLGIAFLSIIFEIVLLVYYILSIVYVVKNM